MSDQPAKPKIIVDDNWKERVQAEKEALQQESQDQQSQSTTEAEASTTDPPVHDVPPASFPLLVTTLATQALAAMGQIPDPEQKEPIVRLDVARHHIDTINILEEKTKGNLTPEETAMMSNVLHELRMLFVNVQGHATKAV